MRTGNDRPFEGGRSIAVRPPTKKPRSYKVTPHTEKSYCLPHYYLTKQGPSRDEKVEDVVNLSPVVQSP